MATMPKLGGRRIPQSSRAIASADLSAPGRAIEQLGNTAFKVGDDMAQRQQQEADAAAVFAVRRKLDDWERANLYDPQNGAVAKLGSDAFDLPNTVPKNFDEFAQTLGQGLTSPRQRAAVQEMIASRRDQALNFVDRHALQQRQVFEEGQFKADIDSSLSRTALLVDAGDLNTAQAETKLAQTRAVGFLKARGKSEEEIASAVRDISSRASVATINLLLEKDKPTEAEAYLKANAGGMKVEDRLRAQAVVGKAVAINDGEKAASAAWDALGPKDYNAPVLLDKMEAEIRKQYPTDAARSKAGIAALRERVLAHNSTQAEIKADSINKVMDVYGKTRSLAAVQKTPEWQALGGSDRMKIEEYITNQQTAALNRGNAADERNQRALKRRGFGAYLVYSSPENLSRMTDAQVQSLLPDLGDDLTNHLMEKKRSMASAEAKAEAKVDQDDFNAVAQRMGLKPFEKGASEEHKAQLGELKFRVEQLIDSAQRNKKAPLSRSEKNELMSQEIARRVSVEGFFSDTEKPVITLTPAELTKVNVPAPDRAQISEAMKARFAQTGDPRYAPTEINLRRWYAMSKSRSAALIPDAK